MKAIKKYWELNETIDNLISGGDKNVKISGPLVFTKVDSEGKQEFESFHKDIDIKLTDGNLQISGKSSSGIDYEEEVGNDFKIYTVVSNEFSLIKIRNNENELWKIKF